MKAKQKIVALTAEVNSIKNKNLRLVDALKKKLNENAKTSLAPQAPVKNKGPKNRKHIPAWKKTPPKKDEPSVKTVGGKRYHWCKHHMAWGIHKPEECKGQGWKPKSEPKVTAQVAKEVLSDPTHQAVEPLSDQQLGYMLSLIKEEE